VHDLHRPLVVALALVRVVQARRRAPDDRAHDAERHVRLVAADVREQLPQILAVEVLHREEVLALRLADVVDLRDVRVVQARRDARLVEEHLDEALIARVLGLDPLEDHVALEAIETIGAREQHVRHPAGGEMLQDGVAPQPHGSHFVVDCAGCALHRQGSFTGVRKARVRVGYMSDAFGTWQLDALIAVGGLGEVWRAHKDSTIAAVKRLHTHLARNAEGLRQFAVEQRLATTLPCHPNVVHGLEAGELDHRPYVALELLGGEDLRRILASPNGPVTIPSHRALAIVTAACDAASHLHHHGWVHGDICPANLIVDPQPSGDRTVLIDLGVARAIGEAGEVRGTHAYMAPEQVKGEAWTRATDVFALGVVLWELIAGQRLFHRGPPWLTLAAVVEADVPALPDARLDAIAQRALAKDPAARIPTPEELADHLRAIT
jgi:hypothetical protein